MRGSYRKARTGFVTYGKRNDRPDAGRSAFLKCARGATISAGLIALVLLVLAGSGVQPAFARVETPSFPCEAARLPSERVICRSDRLAALDTAMVALFEALERRMDASDRDALEREQTAWRASRDACGRRRGCIARSYAQRIEELTGELVPFARAGEASAGRAERGDERTARREAERVEQRRREQEAAARERLERLEKQRAEQEARQRRAEERRAEERDLALREERRRSERPRTHGGNSFTFERTTRASGFCTSYLGRRRAREIACTAEFTRACERAGGGRQCRDVQRFVSPSGRDVTIEFQGDRVMLNGEPAARVSRDCVRARDGLGFCFATERGVRMPRDRS